MRAPVSLQLLFGVTGPSERQGTEFGVRLSTQKIQTRVGEARAQRGLSVAIHSSDGAVAPFAERFRSEATLRRRVRDTHLFKTAHRPGAPPYTLHDTATVEREESADASPPRMHGLDASCGRTAQDRSGVDQTLRAAPTPIECDVAPDEADPEKLTRAAEPFPMPAVCR